MAIVVPIHEPLVLPLSRPVSSAPSPDGGVPNPVLTALAKGADGFWLGGLTTNYFQDTGGLTSADDAGELIGRANGRGPFGRNGTQSSSSLKPALQFDGAFPVARFDGLDDGLSTTLGPGSGDFTYIAVVKVTSTSGFILQSRTAGLNDRAYLSRVGAGFMVTLGAGAYVATVDIANVRAAVGVTFKAGTGTLWHNGAVTGPPVTPGAVASDSPVSVGSGPQGGGFRGDLYHAVVCKGYSFSAAEMADSLNYLLTH